MSHTDRAGRLAWIRGGTAADGPAWKEWVHLVVLTPTFEFVANISLLGAAGRGAAARVIGLVRSTAWSGGVAHIAPGAVAVREGGRTLVAGASSVSWDGAAWRVRVELPEQGVQIDVSAAPKAVPAAVMRLPFGPDARVQWNVVPYALASGKVVVDGRETHLSDAPAYVDHNHGRFSWGEDFVWEWGSFLPDPGASIGPAVFSRLLDAPRHRVRAAGLMTWREGRYDRFYGDHATTVSLEGRWTGASVRTFPPEMVPALPRAALGVPAHVVVSGCTPGSEDRVDIEVVHAARLAIPSERDPLGAIVVWELTGPAARTSTRADGTSRASGRGIVELVRVR